MNDLIVKQTSIANVNRFGFASTTKGRQLPAQRNLKQSSEMGIGHILEVVALNEMYNFCVMLKIPQPFIDRFLEQIWPV